MTRPSRPFRLLRPVRAASSWPSPSWRSVVLGLAVFVAVLPACGADRGVLPPTSRASTTASGTAVDEALDAFRRTPPTSPEAAVEAAARALVASGGLSADHWRIIAELGSGLDPVAVVGARGLRRVAAPPPGTATPAVLMLAMMAGFGSAGDVVARDLDSAVSGGRPISVSDPATDSFTDGRFRSRRDAQRDAETGAQSMRLRTSSSADAQVCPDADGRVVVDVEASVRLDLAGGGARTLTGFAEITTSAHIVGQLADDGTVVSTTFESRQQVAMGDGSNDGSLLGGSFLESSTVAVVPGAVSDVPLDPAHYVDMQIRRRSSRVSESQAAALALVHAYAADKVAATTMSAVEAYWRSGACVDVELRPAAGPRGLAPGSDTDVAVIATAVTDGAPTGGEARASMLGGGAAVNPSTPVPMPATVVYTAPDANLRGGVVAVEVRSRRGVGRAELSMTTGGAWRFDATWAGFRVTGVVCTGSSEPWELAVDGSPGAGVTLTGRLLVSFPQGDDTYGTFTFEGTSSAGGMSFTNTSSGTVQFRVDLDVETAATLTIEPEAGNVTDGRNGRAGVEGVAELRAEAVAAPCG